MIKAFQPKEIQPIHSRIEKQRYTLGWERNKGKFVVKTLKGGSKSVLNALTSKKGGWGVEWEKKEVSASRKRMKNRKNGHQRVVSSFLTLATYWRKPQPKAFYPRVMECLLPEATRKGSIFFTTRVTAVSGFRHWSVKFARYSLQYTYRYKELVRYTKVVHTRLQP